MVRYPSFNKINISSSAKACALPGDKGSSLPSNSHCLEQPSASWRSPKERGFQIIKSYLKEVLFRVIILLVIASLIFGNTVTAKKIEISEKDLEKIKTGLDLIKLYSNLTIDDNRLRTALNTVIRGEEVYTDLTYGLLVLSALNEIEMIDLVISQKYKVKATEYFNQLIDERTSLSSHWKSVGTDISRVILGRFGGQMSALSLDTFFITDKIISIFVVVRVIEQEKLYDGLWRYFDEMRNGTSVAEAWEGARWQMGWIPDPDDLQRLPQWHPARDINETVNQLESQFQILWQKWGSLTNSSGVTVTAREQFNQEMAGVVLEAVDEASLAEKPSQPFSEGLRSSLERFGGNIKKIIEKAKNLTRETVNAIKETATKIFTAIKLVLSRYNPFEAALLQFSPPFPSLPPAQTEEKANPPSEEEQTLTRNIEEKSAEITQEIKQIDQGETTGEPTVSKGPKEIQESLDDIAERIDILDQEITKLISIPKEMPETPEVKKPEEPEEEEIRQLAEEEKPQEEKTKEKEGVKQKLCEKPSGAQPFRDKIILSEIAWMGMARSANDEWIELKNIAGMAISLAGWQLLDEEKQIKVVFSSSEVIPAESFYLLERTNDDSVPGMTADKIYTGSLSDKNEALYLFNENCQLQDIVEAYPNWPAGAGDSKSKRTMERRSDLDWQTSSDPGGTPKKDNSIGYLGISGGSSSGGSSTSPPSYPKILISEIQIAMEGNTKEEFVELYNSNEADLDLTDWYLQRKTRNASDYSTFVPSTLLLAKTIKAKDYFLIVRQDSSLLSLADVITDYPLTEDNTLVLKNPNREIVDKVGFGETEDFETSPTANPLVGKSLGRKWDEIKQTYFDTDNNAADFEIQNPTPKAKNISPPSPTSAPRDTTPPQIAFDPLFSPKTSLSFTLSWSGNDPEDTVSPSGIDGFKMRYSEDKENWIYWPEGSEYTPNKEYLFLGENDHTYYFQLKAKDNAGNESLWSPADFLAITIKLPSKTVVINEIAWMGTKAISSDEWIEFYNNTADTINISSWSIFGADTGKCLNFSDADDKTNTMISGKNYLLYANNRQTVRNSNGISIVDIWDATMGMNNVFPGQLILYDTTDCQGNIVDTANQLSGNWFAGKSDNRISMERINPKLPGNNLENWADNNQTIVNGLDKENNQINGTPKAQNSVYQSFAPNPIGDLTVDPQNSSGNQVALSWTIPEDPDTPQENLVYDIRYSKNEAVDEESWENAVSVQNPPSVGPAGTTQVFTISELFYNSIYYFAIKTFDGKNCSSLSNVVSYNLSSALLVSPWPMFQGNFQRNGQSDYPGPSSTPAIVWKYDEGSDPSNSSNNSLYTNPIIGSDGTIYSSVIFPTSKTGILALNPDGSKKWFKEEEVNFSLALQPDDSVVPDDKKTKALDGTTYEIQGNVLRAIDTEGNEKWQRVFEFEDLKNYPGYNTYDFSLLTLTVSKEGNIYVLASGNIYFSGGQQTEVGLYLYILTPDNNILWSTSFMGAYRPNLLSISSRGTAYLLYLVYGFWQPKLYLLALSNAQTLWSKSFEEYNFVSPIIIDSQENIYFTIGKTVYGFDKNGNDLWQVVLNGVPSGWEITEVGLALGKDGTIYLSGRGGIVALR